MGAPHMLLTRTEAEKACILAAIKRSKWQTAAGYRFRVFMLPSAFDCKQLPKDFTVLMVLADGCVVREQIDDYNDGSGSFIPSKYA